MSRPQRFEPEVYVALRARRHSNREIARLLGVDEASVRRGLTKAGDMRRERIREQRRERQRKWRDKHRDEKRARDRAALLTDRGRARTRRFRLREQLTHMTKTTKEIA